MANTDKNSYTIIFAIIMVVVVGGILASLASGLKPLVKANEKYEKQQNVLYALGVNDNEGPGDVKFLGTDVVEDKPVSVTVSSERFPHSASPQDLAPQPCVKTVASFQPA